MTFSVLLSDDAKTDLFDIYWWVASEAGPEIADAYYARLESRLFALDHYPNRGTPRDDLGENIRTVPFERRLTILYRVERKIVRVLRVVSCARELGLTAQ